MSLLHKESLTQSCGPASVWATSVLCTHFLQLWSLPTLFFRHAGPYLILPALDPDAQGQEPLFPSIRNTAPCPSTGSWVQLMLSDCGVKTDEFPESL